MRKILCALFVAVIVAFAASERSHAVGSDYPPGFLDQFESACVGGGQPAEACTCMARRLDAEVHYRDFADIAAARQGQRLHPLMPTWARIIGECQPSTEGVRASNPDYTDDYVRNFIQGCNQDDSVEAYCTCAVTSLQSLISFDEAIFYDTLAGWGRESEHPRYEEIMTAYRSCAAQTGVGQRNTKMRDAPKFQMSTRPVAMIWPIM